jgi:hypothetical protein
VVVDHVGSNVNSSTITMDPSSSTPAVSGGSGAAFASASFGIPEELRTSRKLTTFFGSKPDDGAASKSPPRQRPTVESSTEESLASSSASVSESEHAPKDASAETEAPKDKDKEKDASSAKTSPGKHDKQDGGGKSKN